MNKRWTFSTLGGLVGAMLFSAWMALPAPASAEPDWPFNTRGARQTWSTNVFSEAGFADQCTAYALDRMHEATGLWMKVSGHAYGWPREARAAGWAVGAAPSINSVMVMSPAPGYKYDIRQLNGLRYKTAMHPLGHVAWVEKIDGDWALIRDQNWRRGAIDSRWVMIKGAPIQYIYAS